MVPQVISGQVEAVLVQCRIAAEHMNVQIFAGVRSGHPFVERNLAAPDHGFYRRYAGAAFDLAVLAIEGIPVVRNLPRQRIAQNGAIGQRPFQEPVHAKGVMASAYSRFHQSAQAGTPFRIAIPFEMNKLAFTSIQLEEGNDGGTAALGRMNEKDG